MSIFLAKNNGAKPASQSIYFQMFEPKMGLKKPSGFVIRVILSSWVAIWAERTKLSEFSFDSITTVPGRMLSSRNGSGPRTWQEQVKGI